MAGKRGETPGKELRQRAEARLEKLAKKPADASEFDSVALTHELRVHQIELEMQNEELRRTTEEAEEERRRYQDLYDFAPVGYLTLDHSGRVTEANLAAASLLGCERYGLVGRPLFTFFVPESRGEYDSFLRSLLAGESGLRCEVRLGANVQRQGWLLFEGGAFVGKSRGKPGRVALMDITERKLAEAKIQELASFPLMNPNPVLELDANGQMIYCNPAAKEILENEGRNCRLNPLIPEDIQMILQDLRERKSGKFSREIEIGDRCFEELIFIALKFHSVRIYTMEITARKRAEVEIKRLNMELAERATELEAFNYTVAHDLRKPLTVINGYCQALQDMCGGNLDEACKGYLQEAYDGTWRMNRLIDALLDFSRLAYIEPRRETVKLSALAHDIASELQLSEPGRLVTFRIADGIMVDGDPDLLRVVLANLLGNAWKYIGRRDAGLIEFGTTEVDGTPVYFVRDNGVGFDMADAGRLFAPFQRLHGAEECKGFGIGLATVERIIRRHGGKVWAEGTPGLGATFYFTLGGGRTN